MPEGRCEDCGRWWKNDCLPGGTCRRPMERDTHPPWLEATWSHATGDEAFGARQGRFAYLHTGPEFGCIHWEPKEERKQDT